MKMQRVPTLVGISGYFAGEMLPLEYGKTIAVGRSRQADFSLRRTRKYHETPETETENDQAMRTVSGRHFEIIMYNIGSIEIVNLSPNGTLVDGKPVDRVIIGDVATNSHTIQIGLNERFSLEMRQVE